MNMMKVTDASRGNDNIQIINVPKPSPSRGQVVLKVEFFCCRRLRGTSIKKDVGR